MLLYFFALNDDKVKLQIVKEGSIDYRGTCEDDYNTYDCYSKDYQDKCDKEYNQTEVNRTTIYYR